MKEDLENWLAERPPLPGVLAGGIIHPDRTTFSHAFTSDDAAPPAADIWPAIAGPMLAAQQQKLPGAHVRWLFERFALYGTVRNDGNCLALLVSLNATEAETKAVDSLLKEFLAL